MIFERAKKDFSFRYSRCTLSPLSSFLPLDSHSLNSGRIPEMVR